MITYYVNLKMENLAIIQARMGSTSLPGKVMKKVGSLPIIHYMISRLRQSKNIDHLLVATSISKTDDTLVEYLQAQNIPVTRGPENDVLTRFYNSAMVYPECNIVRVTADCPLIDANIVDNLISFFMKIAAIMRGFMKPSQKDLMQKSSHSMP